MSEDLRNESLNPANDIETALRKLQPRRSSINRDELLFLAGQAATNAVTPAAVRPKRRWLWPTATMLSMVATVTFAVLYHRERQIEPQERIVYIPAPRVSPIVNLPVPQPAEKVVTAHRRPVPKTRTYSINRFAMASRMLRARHPVLMTDPDYLPNSPTYADGGSGTEKPLSVNSTRRAMPRGLSAADFRPSVLQSIFNSLRPGLFTGRAGGVSPPQ